MFFLKYFLQSSLKFLKALLFLMLSVNCLGQNPDQKPNEILELHEDVVYFLCTKNNPVCPINLNLNLKDLNIDLPVKLIIHGYAENISVQWYKEITDAYFIKNDYNLILVDWSNRANLSYPIAAKSTPSIGYLIGNLLIKLTAIKKIKLDNVHIIGHSLGCHAASFAGSFAGKRIFKITRNKVQRITGLDPAGPLFEKLLKSSEFRLSKEDAHFVDIIHTGGGVFGIKPSIGHADFFPNGGIAVQPGCAITKFQDITEYFCSHQRSYQLFIDSINSEILAKPCYSWKSYEMGLCDNNTDVPFGNSASSKILGDFYLRASDKPLYAIK